MRRRHVRITTLIGVASTVGSAYAFTACTQDFDAFEPGDGTTQPTQNDASTEGSVSPGEGGVPSPTDAAAEASPGCAAAAACASTAVTCESACDQTRATCMTGCGNSNGCKSGCNRDRDRCRDTCTSTCRMCAGSTCLAACN